MAKPIFNLPVPQPGQTTKQLLDAENQRVIDALYGVANPEDRERAEDAADSAEADATTATTQAGIATTQAGIATTAAGTAAADRDAVEAQVAATNPISQGFFTDDFYTGLDLYRAAITDGDGRVLIGWDNDGFANIRLDDVSQAVVFKDDFFTDDVALAVTSGQGRALLQWDAAGQLIGTTTPPVSVAATTPLLAYVDGTNLRTVGASDDIAAPLGDYTVLSTAPGTNDNHARAVVNWPALGPSRSVAVAPDLGLMIPDAANALHVIIGIGQSLMVGSESASTLVSIIPAWPDDALMFERADDKSDVRIGLPTQGTAEVLDPADLIGFVPLVAKSGQGTGSRGETPMEACATALAQQARDIGIQFRSLSFTAGYGGTGYSGLKKGTAVYDNMLIALTRAVELADAQGWNIIVNACLHKHGESDASSSTYLDALIEWQSDIDADVKLITGQTADVHFIMGQPSTHATSTPRAIQAMLDAHNTSLFHHLSGPDYPFGDAYASDELHFTGPGYHWIGDQMARAWKQVLWASAGKSKIVQIIAAERTGTSVVIDYEVPVPPLVFDTETVSERDVKGFRFFDDAGEVTISSAALTGPTQVTLTLATTPSGTDERIEYARRPQSGTRTEENRVRGNLRDSATDVSPYLARHLWNWAVHQSFNL